MAVHDLSTTSAADQTTRMIADAHRAHRAPPRMALPLSARETSVEGVVDEDDPVSASAPTATTMDPAQTVRNILDAIDAVGSDIYTYTTPEERVRIRQTTCPPDATIERTIQTNPTYSLLSTSLIAIGAGVLLGSMLHGDGSASRAFRGSGIGARASSTSKRAVDRMLEYA